MKKQTHLFLALAAAIIAAHSAIAQPQAAPKAPTAPKSAATLPKAPIPPGPKSIPIPDSAPKAAPAKPLSYVTIPNDPLKARIYKLANGLTVYMSVYKDAPRIQTYIATRAGSKNDPADATGLAHYLEHMLFKGTDKYGSLDYSKEKPLLDKIENMYEVYRRTKDRGLRKGLYHRIDSMSGMAAKYAIANEYDKMMAAIGAKGTNAYTSVEQTVYVNDIPSNQLEKWLTIEGERFHNPVLRIFHTELEAVYEEKNRGLDNDFVKLYETLYANVFQKHQYGTQTTIGTIEHLKNPSITKIKQYYHNYYVPNNMAICLSGDFNPDEAIKLIDAKFGQLPSKPIPAFTPAIESPITTPIVKDVYGPDAESIMIGFRFPGEGSKEVDMLTMVDKLLYNGTAGLIDLNLNQQQKVLSASSYVDGMKDYTVHEFSANPREGQSLVEVKGLLLAQIDLLKKGQFNEDNLKAIITNLKLEQVKAYEHNGARADAMVNAFIKGIDWSNATSKIERLSKISKQQIVDFVNKNYGNNYVVVNKHTGEDKNVQKVDKPSITPVAVNRDAQSDFVKSITTTPVADIQPVFIDYQKDIKALKLKNGIEVNYKENTENKTFDLYYVLKMGTNNDKRMGVAVEYLKYLGTSKLSNAALQKEFYKLGCSFNVSSGDDQIYVSLSGLSENFDKAVAQFENLLADAQPNKEALDNLVKDILKKRADAKLSKDVILYEAMSMYGKYGAKSAYTNILSETELKALKPEDLVSTIKSITSYQHHILYYGSSTPELIVASLEKLHKTPATLNLIPAAVQFEEQPTNENVVYVVNYDMKQAEIIMLSKGVKFDASITPQRRIFNEYFGGNMSSVVFQEIRESKALAYSVSASYQGVSRKEDSHYVFAYIGTQADKLSEAMPSMMALMEKMPESGVLLQSSKDAILQKIRTERITKAAVLFNYESAQKIGVDHDLRKDVYEKVPAMEMKDVQAFHEHYLKGNKYSFMVLGDKSKLDMKVLEKYGTIKELSLTDLFGY